MNGKYTIWLFVSAVMILPICVFLTVNWYENKYQQLPIINASEPSLPFRLKNQRGELTTEKDLEGKIIVADFFFTHCGSICPKMAANLKLIQLAVGEDPFFHITSFSIDPERDSVERLKAYASRFEANEQWDFLTGEKKIIYKLARKRFMVDASEGDGGPNDFIHSDKFVLLDQKGQIRGYYKGTDAGEVKQLIDDIRRLKDE